MKMMDDIKILGSVINDVNENKELPWDDWGTTEHT